MGILKSQSLGDGVRDQLEAQGYALLGCLDASEVIARMPWVTGRVGEAEILAPTVSSHARAGSLSAIYGMGAFPWHTDGAIAADPPQYVVLSLVVAADDPARTDILNLNDQKAASLKALLRRSSLELVNSRGQKRHLPAFAMSPKGTPLFRWDPRAKPVGRAASEIPHHLEWLAPTASIDWLPGQFLVIDNYRSMHRRNAVHERGGRRLLRFYIYE